MPDAVVRLEQPLHAGASEIRLLVQGDGLLRRAEMVGPSGLDLDERDDAVGRHHDDVELPVPRMPVAPQNRVSVPFQPIRRILLPQHPQLLGFERAVAQPAQHIAQPRHGRIMIGRSACVFRSACQTGVHDHQCTIKPPSTTWFSANVVEGLPFGVLWMECGRISTYPHRRHDDDSVRGAEAWARPPRPCLMADWLTIL